MKFPFVDIEHAYKDWLNRQLAGTELPGKVWVYPIINDVVDSLLRVGIIWHRIAEIQIKNNQGALPPGYKQTIQAAYYTKPRQQYHAIKTKEVTHFLEGKCKLIVSLECEKCFKTDCTCDGHVFTLSTNDWDYPELKYRDNPQLAYSYVQDPFHPINNQGGCNYHPDFKLLSIAKGNFWNANYYVPNCGNLSVDCEYSYSIEPPHITTNFKEGIVLLAYLSKPTKDGMLMIPDTPKVYEAIRYAIDYEWDYVRSRRKMDNEANARLQLSMQMKTKSWDNAYGELSKLTPEEIEEMRTVFNRTFYQDSKTHLGRDYKDLNDNVYIL